MALVASALNNGDMARATMTAVLMRLPDPDGSIRITDVDGVLAKAGFNPDEPRDERGRWTTEDNSSFEPSAETHDPRTQLADADMSDASDDAAAEAAARAAVTTQRNRATRDSQSKPATRQRGVLQALEDGAESLLTDVGRSQIAESNAEQAVGAAEANAISDVYGAYSSLMERPIGGSMPITPEYPIWGYGDNAQLAPERPITVGDAVSAAGSVVSVLPFGEGARVAADASDLAASEIGAFIVSPKDLPATLDITWPIGRYVIPTNAPPGTTAYGNLVHEQIGRLVQDLFPDVEVILRTSPPYTRDVDIEIPERNIEDFGFRTSLRRNQAGNRLRVQVL